MIEKKAISSKFRNLKKKTINFIDKFQENFDPLSSNRVTGYSINFPITSTCKPTKLCVQTCYGLNGPITWPNSINKQVKNLNLCKKDPEKFASLIIKSCKEKIRKDKNFFLRWNGVGDLFDESVKALKEVNKEIPELPIWCVTRIESEAKKLLNINNIWIHFSLDKYSIGKKKIIFNYSKSEPKNLFFSYQCDIKEKLNQLDKDVSVLFFHNYFIDNYNKKYLNNKNLCPLNILKDLSNACHKCRRCFNGKAVSKLSLNK